MKSSRKISARLNANLREHNREYRAGTETPMPAMNGFTAVRGLRWLAIAGVFLLLGPFAFASVEITGGGGELEASTFICTDPGNCDTVPPDRADSDDGFFDAPIGNPDDPPAASANVPQCSATDQNGNAVSAGPVDTLGEYVGDAQSMTLTTSGSGSADAQDNSSITQVNADSASDITFTVTGEATDVPISVSMTAINCERATASLLMGGVPIGEITADNDGQHGSFPPGPLSPGDYRIQLLFEPNSPSPPTNFNFNFSATITVGEAVPTNEIEWNNSAGGAFHTATNWDPQMVPGAGDTAIFGLESAYSVDVGTVTTERLELRSGDVTFSNANYNVASLNFVPAGTVLDNAVLTLASGTLSGIHALIGESAAARVNVNAGATLNYTGSLQVGGPGHGDLVINDGFVFSGEGRIGSGVGGGQADLAGPGALWDSGSLSVGFFSGVESNLFVSGGATLVSDIGSVGFSPGSDGFVEIKGDLSTWDLNGNLKIGEGGFGELNVLDGALVTCPNLTVGIAGVGNVLVKGIGNQPSLVDVADLLIVGEPTSGLLDIEDGAEVRTATGIFIGFGETGVGTINVLGKSTAGPSLLDTLGDIIVGFAGPTAESSSASTTLPAIQRAGR
jgi:T5SS/PEP-CTERM-associated repeat protein